VNPVIAAMMLIGEREEPFLGACLENLAPAIDWLVVNDNSVSPQRNREVVRGSTLGRTGRVHVVPSAFLGFGPCRMLCVHALRARVDERWWILKVDSDEVHHEGLRVLTREVLPCLPSGIGIVDGYVFQLCPSPRYCLSVDRRHDLLFRFSPDVQCVGHVHERLVNLRGRRVAVPYRYFHYGYVASLEQVRQKWQQYGELGDAVSGCQAERVAQIVAADARRARRYAGQQPPHTAAALDEYAVRHRAEVGRFETAAQSVAAWRNVVAALGRGGALGLVAARWALRPAMSPGLRRAVNDLARCQRALEAAR
jgi:hypothetical protein